MKGKKEKNRKKAKYEENDYSLPMETVSTNTKTSRDGPIQRENSLVTFVCLHDESRPVLITIAYHVSRPFVAASATSWPCVETCPII